MINPKFEKAKCGRFLLFLYLILFNQFSLLGQNVLKGKYDAKYNTYDFADKKYLSGTFKNENVIFCSKPNRVNYGVINKRGEVIIEPKYSFIELTNSGYIRVSNYSDLIAIYDSLGKEVLPFKYQYIENNIANITRIIVAGNDNKVGVINASNLEAIIPLQYRNIYKQNEYYIAEKNEGNTGVLNSDGKIIIPFIYSSISHDDFDNTFQLINQNQYLVTNVNSDTLFYDSTYTSYLRFKNGLIPYPKGAFYGYINYKKEFVINDEYKFAQPFSDSVAVVYKDGFYGVIDAKGKIRLPFKYHSLESFINGLAVFSKDDKFGILDKSGNVVLQPIYDEVIENVNGYSVVVLKKKQGLVNKFGKLIIPINYDQVSYVPNDPFIIVKNQNKNGVFSITGKQLYSLQFDDVLGFHNGLALCYKNYKTFMINVKGQMIK
jgi:WG containing repeat